MTMRKLQLCLADWGEVQGKDGNWMTGYMNDGKRLQLKGGGQRAQGAEMRD